MSEGDAIKTVISWKVFLQGLHCLVNVAGPTRSIKIEE